LSINAAHCKEGEENKNNGLHFSLLINKNPIKIILVKGSEGVKANLSKESETDRNQNLRFIFS
jgi:hypothetical protein